MLLCSFASTSPWTAMRTQLGVVSVVELPDTKATHAHRPGVNPGSTSV